MPADPVVAAIRTKLSDPAVVKDANASDVAALVAFYGARTGAPLWVTDMGFTARAQSALFEIEKAEDWGLTVSAFTLPPAGALPRSADEQAKAEIDLDLAILKYARHARGGGFIPLEVSKLYDLSPPIRDPGAVLAEISTSSTPDAYLRSLHPKHEQFQRLHQALLKARGKSEEGAKPASEKDIKRLLVNMERWRWMPEDLGHVYVLNNSPEFMLTCSRTASASTPTRLWSALGLRDTRVLPPISRLSCSILIGSRLPRSSRENLLPALSQGKYSILRGHGLSVSLNGRPVDPSRVSWNRSNILGYTFSQRGGPTNVLGKAKFLYPNRHTVYMHDTLPVRKKYFSEVAAHDRARMRAHGEAGQICQRPPRRGQGLGRRQSQSHSGTAGTAVPSRSTARSPCIWSISPPWRTTTARSQPLAMSMGWTESLPPSCSAMPMVSPSLRPTRRCPRLKKQRFVPGAGEAGHGQQQRYCWLARRFCRGLAWSDRAWIWPRLFDY